MRRVSPTPTNDQRRVTPLHRNGEGPGVRSALPLQLPAQPLDEGAGIGKIPIFQMFLDSQSFLGLI